MNITTWDATMHWSYASPAWCGFIGIADDHRCLVRHELVMRETTPEQAVILIYKAMLAWEIPRVGSFILPVQEFPEKLGEGGETVSETFGRAGLPVVRGDEQLRAGFMRLRSWMTPVPQANGIVSPSLLIHADCKRLLRMMPTLVSKDTDPDVMVESPNAFPIHALRRFVMSRPMPKDTPVALPHKDAIYHLVQELRDAANAG